MAPRILTDAQIQERIRKHTSARYSRLDKLERYVAGTQYEGRPSWFDDSVELFSRAPCIVSPIVKTAIASHVGMIFRRAPVITSAPDEDETKIDPDFGLGEDVSKKLDAGLVQVMRHASLLPTLKALLAKAMGGSSVVAIPVVRNGRLAVDVMSAKWCKPTFSKDDPRKVESLEIRYPFLQDVKDEANGRWYKVVMLFRRVIDAARDMTYQPVEAPDRADIEPVWVADKTKTIEHNLGFCPVHWYRFMGAWAPTHEIDGEAIHATILDEIVALDFAISQRHRAVLYNADPITYETGVMEGYVPTETVMSTAYYGPGDAPENAQYRLPQSRPNKIGRRRGPGSVWQYPSSEAKVGLLSLPSDAVQACQVNAGDLKDTICAALRWNPIDPKQMQSGATLSGRALEILYTDQVTYCNDVRADFAEGAMLPVVDMLLRLIVTMKTRGESLYLPGFEVMAEILSKFHDEKADGAWMTPRLSVNWPPYFTPNEADKKIVSETVRADVQAGLIKRATGIMTLAKNGVYEIENPAQYAEDLDKEDAEKEASLQASQMALQAAAQKPQAPTAAPPKVAARPVRPVTQNGSRKPKPPAVVAPPTGKPPQAKVMQ